MQKSNTPPDHVDEAISEWINTGSTESLNSLTEIAHRILAAQISRHPNIKRQDVEDAIQGGVLRFLERLPEFDPSLAETPRSAFFAWVHWIGRKQTQTHTRGFFPHSKTFAAGNDVEQVAAHKSPEDSATDNFRNQEIVEFSDTLSELIGEDDAALVLRLADGESLDSVSASTGLLADELQEVRDRAFDAIRQAVGDGRISTAYILEGTTEDDSSPGQCLAVRSNGQRCERMADNGGNYCWHHKAGGRCLGIRSNGGKRCNRPAENGGNYCYYHKKERSSRSDS